MLNIPDAKNDLKNDLKNDSKLLPQVLARIWRPQNLDEMVGQEHATTALAHALNSKKLHHAYLLTGTRGVGKTSLARILSKALNCEQGIQAKPCGVCQQCVSIQRASNIDYIEIDAASHRGVEEMSSILENAIYQPSQARFKIFMIDEVHMLSQHAFNAMLKILEEPPHYTKFILATTETQKIPATIVSRCLQFHLKNLSIPVIAEQLAFILTAENIEYETPALHLLAKYAMGSMRDALSLTDQAIALGQGRIALPDIEKMLGSQSYLSLEILQAIVMHDLSGAIKKSESYAQAPALMNDLLEHLHHIAMQQSLPQYLEDIAHPQQNQYLSLSQIIPALQVQMMYEVIIKAKQNFEQCPIPQIAVNMLILRLSHFILLKEGNLAAHTAAMNTNVRQNNDAPLSAAAKIAIATQQAHTRDPSLLMNEKVMDGLQTKAKKPSADLAALLDRPILTNPGLQKAFQKIGEASISLSEPSSVDLNSINSNNSENYTGSINPVDSENSRLISNINNNIKNNTDELIEKNTLKKENLDKNDESKNDELKNDELKNTEAQNQQNNSENLLDPEQMEYIEKWPHVVKDLQLSGLALEFAKHTALQSINFEKNEILLIAGMNLQGMKIVSERFQTAINNYFGANMRIYYVNPNQTNQNNQVNQSNQNNQSNQTHLNNNNVNNNLNNINSEIQIKPQHQNQPPHQHAPTLSELEEKQKQADKITLETQVLQNQFVQDAQKAGAVLVEHQKLS